MVKNFTKMVVPDDKSVRKLLTVQNGIRRSSIRQAGEKMKFEKMEEAQRLNDTFAKPIETKIYKRRWLQLVLFFALGAVNSMQWIQFTIIGNIISRYYGVSSMAVDWTSIIFHVTYVVLIFPASYLMDHVGLRWTCLIGGIGTTIGAWIKFLSLSPDRFFSALFGQALVAASQIVIANGPPRLSANWFGSKEVATATSIGCSGSLTGISLLFLITPMIVKNHERIEDIGEELSTLFLAVAVACTVVASALFLFFQDDPRLPPSVPRALQLRNRKSGSEEFWSTFRRILSNRPFLMHWNSYGMSLGYLNAASTLLNPLFLAHFQNGERDAGKLGLLMSFPGTFGSVIFSMILDRTKKFRTLNIFIYVFCLVGEILFAVSLITEVKWLVFVSVVVISIFTISHASIGFELSAEGTYPEPEILTSGLLNMGPHVYGAILALIVGSLVRNYGDTVAHACLGAVLALGLTLTIFTKTELKRQNARGDGHYEPVASLEIAVKDNEIPENKSRTLGPD